MSFVIYESYFSLTPYINFTGKFYPFILLLTPSSNTPFSVSLSPEIVKTLLTNLSIHFSSPIAPHFIHIKSYSPQNYLPGLIQFAPLHIHIYDHVYYNPSGFTLNYPKRIRLDLKQRKKIQ